MFALVAFACAKESVKGDYYTDMPPYSVPSAQSPDATAERWPQTMAANPKP
jgi:hypothetical protein